MARNGLLTPALLLALALPGCGREGAEAAARIEVQPRDAAGTSISLGNLRPDWEVNRALPEREGAGPFAARRAPAPLRAAPQAPRDTAALAEAATPVPQPPPFAYVGKVARGDIGYAVLARDGKIFLVRAGDTLERYSVQSVSEREVVVLSVDSGSTHSVVFSSAAPAASVLPTTAAGSGATEELSPQASEPGG